MMRSLQSFPERTELKKIFNHRKSLFGKKAFRVKQHAVKHAGTVRQPHNNAVGSPCTNFKVATYAVGGKRMITGNHGRQPHTAKEPPLRMVDRANLTVH